LTDKLLYEKSVQTRLSSVEKQPVSVRILQEKKCVFFKTVRKLNIFAYCAIRPHPKGKQGFLESVFPCLFFPPYFSSRRFW